MFALPWTPPSWQSSANHGHVVLMMLIACLEEQLESHVRSGVARTTVTSFVDIFSNLDITEIFSPTSQFLLVAHTVKRYPLVSILVEATVFVSLAGEAKTVMNVNICRKRTLNNRYCFMMNIIREPIVCLLQNHSIVAKLCYHCLP